VSLTTAPSDASSDVVVVAVRFSEAVDLGIVVVEAALAASIIVIIISGELTIITAAISFIDVLLTRLLWLSLPLYLSLQHTIA